MKTRTILLLLALLPAAAQAAAPKQLSSNAPVEINSDKLEVFQEKNLAVFTGHVVAIQGDVRLKSEKMTVHYRKPSEEKKPEGAAPDPAPAPVSQGAIQRIDVDGGVFLTTPEETASGATGVYDVERHTIQLNDNVVLTRGNNTLTGDALIYDFNTGKSTIVGQAGGNDTTRVRALFVPEGKEQKKKP